MFFCLRCFFYEGQKINERVKASTYVLFAEKPKSEYGESKVDHVIEFATHLPGWDTTWIGFALEVVSTSVEPMSIAVNMKFIVVSELIEWAMLKVMGLCNRKINQKLHGVEK